MLNITSDMLLEGTNSLFGDVRISNSKITNENYFDTALEEASSIEAEYVEAKAKLYNGLANSTEEIKDMFSKAYTRSFPEKDEKLVGESCTSTEHFISFFGKSAEILNKAAGNIADSCDCLCKQVDIVTKEAAKVIGEQSKTDLCPVCKGEPCSCKKREDLFVFTTDHGIKITDFKFPNMDEAIAAKDSFESLYNSMVVEAADVAAKRRGELSGLDRPIDVTLFGEAVISNFRSTNKHSIQVNHRYLDYCIETVNTYKQRANEMISDAKRIANAFREAASKVSNVMTATSTMQYIKEDGNVVFLEDEEQVQNMDLYCKAKVDELVAACMEYLTAIGAKLDAMKCEFDQCKAVLSKYVCNNAEPVALPDKDVSITVNKNDAPAPDDGVSTSGEPIQEKPCNEVDYSAEYESFMMGGLDIGDTRDMEEYRESYESFLIDMISHEATLTGYINGEILAESDQVFTEGAIGKTKGLLHRISEFIKKIWGKFKNAMASLFQNDQKYLAANENTIKNVKPKSCKVDGWYWYKRDRIVKDNAMSTVNNSLHTLLQPGQFVANMSKLDQKLASCGDAKNGLANTFVTFFGDCDNSRENNTKDKFRTYFRDYPVSINANTLTQQERSAMYDYCFNFKQGVQDVLQKDIDTIIELQSNADQAMQQLMSAVEQKEAKAKAAADNSVNNQNASTDMASALDMYFSEDNLSFGATQKTEPKNGNVQGTTAQSAVKADGVDQNAINNSNSQNNKNIANGGEGAKEATKENAETFGRIVSNVFNLAKDYTSVKLSMAENAYRQYISFFRWHVGQYAGTDQQQKQGGDNIDTSQATVNNGQ